MQKITRWFTSTALPGGFGAGAGAAIVMMVLMALLRFTTNTASIPELLENSLTKLAGGQVESFFINTLGVGGKALLLVSIVEGTLLLGAILGWVFTRFWAIRRLSRWANGALYGLVVGLFLNVLVLPLFGQGFFGVDALKVTAPSDISRNIYGTSLAPIGLPAWLNMFVLSLVFALALVAILPWERLARTAQVAPAVVEGETSAAAPVPAQAVAPESQGRRAFLRTLAGGGVAILGGAALWGVLTKALQAPQSAALVEVDTGPDGGGASPGGAQGSGTPVSAATPGAQSTGGTFDGVKPKLVPEITPVDSFYITTKNYIDPTVDGDSWKLSFTGLVENPYSITLADLRTMKAVERVETLECISNPVGGPLISNARWKGVSFADLLNRAKPKPGVVDVIVRAYDGYSDSFTIDVAMHNDCLLVYEMNGAPLVPKHGYPARLLVPGIFGMKNCKWITQVELASTDYQGYWQERGWSDPAPYLTMSRIDYPDQDTIPAKPLYIGGIAFSGNRGIKRVEVSTDGGKSWHDAQLRTPLGPYTWVQWIYPWNPQPGTYTLTVRATDGTGALQSAQMQDTFPDGASGYDMKQVTVSQ